MKFQYDYTILELINNAIRTVKAAPLVLGATSSGSGGPIGGYVGFLPQTRVSYDQDELAMSGFMESGAYNEELGIIVSGSLLDNLNHIRWRIQALESGGGGSSSFLGLTDTPDSYVTFSGYVVTVNDTEDGLIFSPFSGGGSQSFTPNSIPFAGSDTYLTVSDLLRWDEDLRSIRIGNSTFFSEYNWADLIPIGVVAKNAGEQAEIAIYTYGDSATPGFPTPDFVGYRSKGTIDTPEAVTSGNYLVSFRGRGFDGVNWVTGTQIRGMVASNWSPSSRHSNIEFLAVPSGGTVRQVVATMEGDGHLNIGSGKQFRVNGSQHTHDASNITSGEIKMVPSDASSIYKRILSGRADYTWIDFDETSLPSAFAGWAGAPFVTPDTVNLTTYTSVLTMADATAGDRAFLYISSAPTTGRGLLGVFGFSLGTDAFVGLRIDDGSDNNYVEAGIYGGGTSKWLMRTYYRTGGGAVVTTTATDAAIGPLMPQVLLNITGTRWTSWGFNGWLSYPQNQSAFLAQMNLVAGTTGLTWTPTRIGIAFRNITSINVAGVERFGY